MRQYVEKERERGALLLRKGEWGRDGKDEEGKGKGREGGKEREGKPKVG